MRQHWRHVTFAHWQVDPAEMARVLPVDVRAAGLRPDTLEGAAWVGLVAFQMDDLRPPGLPWLSSFPETNLRTYVRGPDGEPGLWFFSLEAARLAAVLAGRTTFGLPYCWSAMRVEVEPARVSYHSRRRWPGPRGASCRLAVELGAPVIEPGELDRWLTERYRLFTQVAGRLVTATAEHPPWELATATLLDLDETLLRAAGLAQRTDPPRLHYSAGVRARLGGWRRVRPA
ncbi:MAG: DUF2071 domain-containing protein [Sporichthyaceae bacterium]|nr:DUF2071 domain-containing protein [Sporichthyaceae bacterium]